MKKQHLQPQKASKKNGYSITELVTTSLIIGTLSSIAYPNYVSSNNNSQLADAKSSVLSIPSIIGAYIDSTGEAPKTWEDLSTIAVVMTNNGPATGDLTSPITLPNSIYDLSVEGPTESVYTMTATRVADKNKKDPERVHYQYAIKSCFDVSNGASDLRTGTLADIENELNCG